MSVTPSSPVAPITRRLQTPQVARLVDAAVFDDFAWCESDTLEWRAPRASLDCEAPVDGADPTRMVFVFHDPRRDDFLPRELARLHAPGLGLVDEEALAPYGIDDATDGLHARRRRPREVFWLAADNLNALFWGLHDWAHFHDHGPFERRAETELQCDATALAWIKVNLALIGLDDVRFEMLRRQVVTVVGRRFAEEKLSWEEAVLEAEAIDRLARDATRDPNR